MPAIPIAFMKAFSADIQPAPMPQGYVVSSPGSVALRSESLVFPVTSSQQITDQDLATTLFRTATPSGTDSQASVTSNSDCPTHGTSGVHHPLLTDDQTDPFPGNYQLIPWSSLRPQCRHAESICGRVAKKHGDATVLSVTLMERGFVDEFKADIETVKKDAHNVKAFFSAPWPKRSLGLKVATVGAMIGVMLIVGGGVAWRWGRPLGSFWFKCTSCFRRDRNRAAIHHESGDIDRVERDPEDSVSGIELERLPQDSPQEEPVEARTYVGGWTIPPPPYPGLSELSHPHLQELPEAHVAPPSYRSGQASSWA
ncbi:hypothetical protein QFC20_003684 [Naganishia adeliensis]|uniref:Uncharacterized protein n=1 Tax=Naganishia adeliensis TaxID=92952 RepID=A0ACC2W973_9TREE|nr:hypothetical protein QFC20_003684 [Naganishia adeliensis]